MVRNVGLAAMVMIIVGVLSGSRASAQAKLTPGTFEYTLNIDRLERHYVVHVPRRVAALAPVVIVLHGAGGNADNALAQGKWIAKSEKEGFLAVALDGTRKFAEQPANLLTNPPLWNDGSGRGATARREVDDVGFVNAVIDELIRRGGVDSKRIYVTGFSNGASMTWRVGAELSSRVAAIAPVSGHMWLKDINLDRPISALFIAGTADPLNPIDGGPTKDPWTGQNTPKPPMKDSLSAWLKAIECPAAPKITTENGVTQTVYNKCKNGTEAIYYVIEGMGHTWPGGRSFLPESVIGKATDKMDATDVIWTFFQRH
jgi:polyhydroxybutyrate depolymerase